MRIKNIVIFCVALVFCVSSISQTSTRAKHLNILESLTKEDTISHASVKIHQDKRIESLLIGKKANVSPHEQLVSGFRVQVFSSNQQHTAKTEAFRVEKLIRDQFPTLGVYVNYTSPFWKVRVGDFSTQAEATSFRNELISAFPTMRSETYIVKEQILISGSN
jgi:hypothetical protein